MVGALRTAGLPGGGACRANAGRLVAATANGVVANARLPKTLPRSAIDRPHPPCSPVAIIATPATTRNRLHAGKMCANRDCRIVCIDYLRRARGCVVMHCESCDASARKIGDWGAPPRNAAQR
jgi:hypothetical protein